MPGSFIARPTLGREKPWERGWEYEVRERFPSPLDNKLRFIFRLRPCCEGHFVPMATWSTLTPSDLWGVVLEITSKYADKKLNLSNFHRGRAKVGGFSPIFLMWNITHFNCRGHKYQHSEMCKWYSCERCLEKPGSNANPRPSSFEEVSTFQTQGSSFEERHQHPYEL